MRDNDNGRMDHWANSPILMLTARIALIASATLLAVLSYLAEKTLDRLDAYAQQVMVIAQSVAVQQTKIENHEKRLDRIEGPRDR